MFPGRDQMSLQMRISVFHVIFNVTTTCLLLPFVKQLVRYSRLVIKDKDEKETLTLKFVDDRLLSMPTVALMQVKKEIDYMIGLAQDNIRMAFDAMENCSVENGKAIHKNEDIIDFTNCELTRFLIKLSANVEQSDEKIIGSSFHVLNDVERIGDHAENFYGIAKEMHGNKILFSEKAQKEIKQMFDKIVEMFDISKDAFENMNKNRLPELTALENDVDNLKKDLTVKHFARLAEGKCRVEVSPYYSSAISGLERVADHLVNVGYSIVNPVGSQREID